VVVVHVEREERRKRLPCVEIDARALARQLDARIWFRRRRSSSSSDRTGERPANASGRK
jgi:hypothetical protein